MMPQRKFINKLSIMGYMCGNVITFSLLLMLSLPSIGGTSLRPLSGDISSTAAIYGNSTDSFEYSACNKLTTCGNCTNTYRCHWCEHDNSCHAKGSRFGCARGVTCKDVNPPKKNNTCASQTTCSECALSSHFCHWCEHDNACHAVGSRFGCAMGVNCYSNDRCRRSEAEPLPRPPSLKQAIIGVFNRVPTIGIIIIVLLFGVSFGCLSICFCFVSNIKGAYDDLAEITIAASVAPMSIIGDVHFNRLDEFPGDTALVEEGDESNNRCAVDNSNESNDSAENMNSHSDTPMTQPLLTSQQREETPLLSEAENIIHEQTDVEGDSPHTLPSGIRQSQDDETRTLLQSSFHETSHMKRLGTLCSVIYYLSTLVLLLMVGMVLFFYPKMPIYNVCNDEVAWAGIMKNIIAFKFDASFEILASLSNPNHFSIALDSGKGSFSFDGKPFGTFEIPPLTADPMAITDFMMIIHISPDDKYQAIQLVEAYYTGNLVLHAEAKGTIRIPALFDYSHNINVDNIVVDINAASDRKLCRCPTWDDDKNHSIPDFLQSMEYEVSLL